VTSLAARFSRVFAGLDRAYGWYAVPVGTKPDAHGKLLGRRATVREPVTLDLWERHIVGEGGFGIGITPIRDDATCVFGAIDVDVYPLDIVALNEKVQKLGLPVIVCRTKSGGAHVYVFFSEPVPASDVRAALSEWAPLLGCRPDVEIFPKQTRLAGDEDVGQDNSGCGSWINIPYNGGARSTRYALDDAGEALSPEGFLERVADRATSRAELAAFRPKLPTVDEDLLFEAPPCLEELARRGFGDWQNNGLFNIAVYLKKRFPDDLIGLPDRLEAYNRRLMDPPTLRHESLGIARSVLKKAYRYKCKDQPVCAACDPELCRTRKFGVRGGLKGSDLGVAFGELVKVETDPPTWLWDVDGARLELTSDQIIDQRLFRKVALNALDRLLPLIQAQAWDKLVNEKLATVNRKKVPEDATKDGQLLVHLQRFCTSRVRGRSLDEILMGKPFTDATLKRVFFCSSDFLQYLQQHRVNGVSEKDLYILLRDRDLETHSGDVKGKPLSYWSLPAFRGQTEDHAVPRSAPLEAM